MKQIFVESNKNYYHGFVLKEQDIRRIIDLIVDQFKKVSSTPVEFIYTLKFKNGAIANTPNLEDVLKQENEGSTSIVRLQISATQEKEMDGGEDIIKIDFRNTDVDDELGENPIGHSIKGQSRDWVFVTSSLIEERLTKIKRKSLDHLFARGLGRLFFKLLVPILMLGIMAAFLAGAPSATNKIADKQLILINQIEEKWKNKIITDPIDAIIQIERTRNEKDYRVDTGTLFSDLFLTTPIVIAFSILIGLMIMALFVSKIYPVYNFVWGNYLETFSKKESRRRLIIGIVIGTIALGIIVNLLSNFIWEKL